MCSVDYARSDTFGVSDNVDHTCVAAVAPREILESQCPMTFAIYKGSTHMPQNLLGMRVCVFITAGPITKLFAGGGRRRVEDMCYDRRRAEACVDESAHHALANAGWDP